MILDIKGLNLVLTSDEALAMIQSLASMVADHNQDCGK